MSFANILNIAKGLVKNQVAKPITSTLKTGAAASFGLYGLYTEVNTVGREYGTGYGVVKGLAYNVPILGAGMIAYDVGKSIGDYAYNKQRAKRKSSFTQGFSDPFGTAATMRQRSQYNVNRGRASIGSEAYLFR